MGCCAMWSVRDTAPMRLLLVLAVLACSCKDSPPPPKPAAQAPPPKGDPLEQGHPIEKPFAAGQSHRYYVKVAKGQVLLATVEQKGIDVMVRTFDPAGKRIAEIDSPNGQKGPEPLVIDAKRTGTYGIEVVPFTPPADAPGAGAMPPPAPNASYEIRIDEVIASDAYAERRIKERLDSPRMVALWMALRAKRKGAAEAFWAEVKGKTPIVEPFPGDPKFALVTFVFRSKARYVGLMGGPSVPEKPMLRMQESDIWYLTAKMPTDSRSQYAFIAGDDPPDYHVPWKKDAFGGSRWDTKAADPNNPKQLAGLSIVELADLPAQPWTMAKPENPAGKIVEVTIESAQMKEKRRIGVYTPPDYDPKRTYPLVIAFDGEVYGLDEGALIPLPRILDNLIAAKQIPPVVAAIVANQGTRSRDLTMHKPFAEFVATELIPKLRADYRAGMTAATTLVTGSSFGGVCSVNLGLVHSDVVGLVLSQSGAFWFRPGDLDSELPQALDEPRLPHLFATAPKLPLKFYLDAGLFESELSESILSLNRRMRDVLIAKGYPVKYVEYSGGHDYSWWRGTIADGLIFLLGTPPKPQPAAPTPPT